MIALNLCFYYNDSIVKNQYVFNFETVNNFVKRRRL